MRRPLDLRSLVAASRLTSRRTLFTRAATLAGAAALRPPVRPASANTGASAALAPDWDVPGGHFYTQTAPPDAPADSGYPVLDADHYTFWRDYENLGGPTALGFPVSDRFEADGNSYQVAETALLHWNPHAARAEVFPVFASFAATDMDGWLEAQGIPPTSPELLADPGLPPDARLSWLAHATLRDAYLSNGQDAAVRRYGLPMGEPQRMGPYMAQRFENAVMQLWLDNVPGQPPAGSISLVRVADLLRAAELVPEEAFAPVVAPAPRPAPVAPAPQVVAPGAPPASAVAGRHVVVSLSRQWWYAYSSGELLYSGPVTTGRPELRTPIGRFTVLSRHSPYTFISPWPYGSPFWYETAVSRYALRITGNGVFLHDAPWRPYNGPGTNVPHVDPDGVWRTGSHGCINMPVAAAAWLYNWAPVGTPVDVVA